MHVSVCLFIMLRLFFVNVATKCETLNGGECKQENLYSNIVLMHAVFYYVLPEQRFVSCKIKSLIFKILCVLFALRSLLKFLFVCTLSGASY